MNEAGNLYQLETFLLTTTPDGLTVNDLWQSEPLMSNDILAQKRNDFQELKDLVANETILTYSIIHRVTVC